MSTYRCNKCDGWFDNDYSPCSQDPDNELELICEDCTIELENEEDEDMEFSLEQSAKLIDECKVRWAKEGEEGFAFSCIPSMSQLPDSIDDDLPKNLCGAEWEIINDYGPDLVGYFPEDATYGDLFKLVNIGIHKTQDYHHSFLEGWYEHKGAWRFIMGS